MPEVLTISHLGDTPVQVPGTAGIELARQLAVADIRAAAANAQLLSTGHRLFVEGSSKAQIGGNGSPVSWLFWALARRPLDLKYDYTRHNLAIFGGRSGTESALGNDAYGGTQPTGMLTETRKARAFAAIAAGCDIAIVDNDTNDLPDATTDQTIFDNFQTWHELMRAEGLEHCFRLSVDPRGGASETVQEVCASLNHAYAEYARKTPDCTFIDLNGLMLIGDGSGYLPAAGVLHDGVHEPAPTNYRKAPIIAEHLARIAPPKPMRAHVSEDYNATTGRRNNLLANSRFRGTGGTNSMTGGTGSAPDGWEFINSTSGLTLALGGQVDWTHGNTLYGRADQKALRLTVSGTPGADGLFGCRQTVNFANLAVGMKLFARIGIQCTAVTGLMSIGISVNTNAGNGIAASWGRAGGYLSHDVLPQLDGFYWIEIPDAITIPVGATECSFRIECHHRSGTAIGGVIDFVVAEFCKADTLP